MIWDAGYFWGTLAALVIVAGLVSVGIAYRKAGRTRAAFFAAALKSVVLVMLGLILAGPLLQTTRVVPRANDFVILIDDSRSQQLPATAPDDEFRTRHQRTAELFTEANNSWLAELGRQFRVRSYAFDTAVRPLKNPNELRADGDASRVYRSLEEIRERYQSRPLAGVLLISDGAATDRETDIDPTRLPPIYPVAWDEPAERPDLRVRSVNVEESLFEDAPVRIFAEILLPEAAESDVIVALRDEQGKTVESRTIPAADARPQQTLSFEVPRRGIERHVYTVEATFSNPAIARQEPTDGNNRQSVIVPARDREFRVLYVAGRPNWEFKFLRRSLEADDQVELVGLLRIARGKRSIDWRSRGSGMANTLFRGFDGDKELAAEYDEPVLVRLNTASSTELAAGFPAEPEELFAYDGLILDDIEADFFTQDQLELIERYVSDRGGGLMMLGGADSFAEGGYARTSLGRVLPLSVPVNAQAAGEAPVVRWDLSREGWHTAWARLRRQEDEERERLSEMPPFRVINRMASAKPGAMLLAEAVDLQGRRIPALAAQRFGEGRSMAVAVGDLWRWHLRSAQHEQPRDEAAQYWRQLLRWTVTATPERLEAEVLESDAGQRTGYQIAVRLRDKEFQPLPYANVTVELTDPDGTTSVREAEPVSDAPGDYAVPFQPGTSGAYHIAARATDADTGEELTQATNWIWQPDADELATARPHPDALQRLAEQSGGEVVSAARLDAFVRSLPAKSAPVVEPLTHPLWHYPAVLLLLLSALGGEWLLRKRRGWR